MIDTKTGTALPEDKDIELLLPWYATGRLSAEQRAGVERYLATHPDAARNLMLARDEARAVHDANEALAPPPAVALDDLLERIEDEDAPVVETVERGPTILQRLQDRFARIESPLIRYGTIAAGALIFVQAVVIATLLLLRDSGDDQSASDKEVVSHGTSVLIAFHDDATTGSVSQVLGEVGGSIIAGPKANGLFVVRVSSEEISGAKLQKIISHLQNNSSIVRFVAASE